MTSPVTDYTAWQVAQLAAPQLAQPSPLIAAGSPLSSVVKQAKVDNTRSALCWQPGQAAASVAWLNGRNCSNLVSQSWQRYSYIGIFQSPVTSLVFLHRQVKLFNSPEMRQSTYPLA